MAKIDNQNKEKLSEVYDSFNRSIRIFQLVILIILSVCFVFLVFKIKKSNETDTFMYVMCFFIGLVLFVFWADFTDKINNKKKFIKNDDYIYIYNEWKYNKITQNKDFLLTNGYLFFNPDKYVSKKKFPAYIQLKDVVWIFNHRIIYIGSLNDDKVTVIVVTNNGKVIKLPYKFSPAIENMVYLSNPNVIIGYSKEAKKAIKKTYGIRVKI